MEPQTFEDYLAHKHIEQNPQVLDDDLPDAFNQWLTELDVEQLIQYGDDYANMRMTEKEAA